MKQNNLVLIHVYVTEEQFQSEYDAPEYDRNEYEPRWHKKTAHIIKKCLHHIFNDIHRGNDKLYIYNVGYLYGSVFEWAIDKSDGLGYQELNSGNADVKFTIISPDEKQKCVYKHADSSGVIEYNNL